MVDKGLMGCEFGMAGDLSEGRMTRDKRTGDGVCNGEASMKSTTVLPATLGLGDKERPLPTLSDTRLGGRLHNTSQALG